MTRSAILLLALVSSTALASPPAPLPSPPISAGHPPATVHVTCRAEVSEAPNRVYIDLGVATQAATSQAASRENTTRIQAVLAALRRVAGPDVQLTTSDYALRPNYRRPSDRETSTIAGYTATDIVRVRLDDLSRIGQVIDAATRAGANRVDDLRFTLRDAEAAQAEALQKAALNARAEARALAGALDLRIVRIVSADEQSPTVVPIRQVFGTAITTVAPRAPTPIESGTLNVIASVTLTVEVTPAGR
ncbi:MAG: SIMPL domain-containing protein [Steroidobacteraceae bacterium]